MNAAVICQLTCEAATSNVSRSGNWVIGLISNKNKLKSRFDNIDYGQYKNINYLWGYEFMIRR